MDTAVLTLRGRGDRREGETDVSRQRPATCIRCQVLPMEDSQRQAQSKENNTIGPVQRLQRGEGGDVVECWQGSSLVKEEVPGRYGCRPKSICMSLRFVETKPGRQENLFCFFVFFINRTWFTTAALRASSRRSPIKRRTSYTLTAESINSSETDGFQEPENESPTITRETLCVCNYWRTLWNSVWNVPTWHMCAVNQSLVSKVDTKLVKIWKFYDKNRAVGKACAWLRTCPKQSLDFHHTPILKHLQLSLWQETVKTVWCFKGWCLEISGSTTTGQAPVEDIRVWQEVR